MGLVQERKDTMPNFGTLLQELGGLTGDFPDAALRGRYLREADIIDRSAKDPNAPQVEEVHAVSMLLAVLANGLQVNAASDTRKLWALKPVGLQAVGVDLVGNEVRSPPEVYAGAGLTFGQRLAMAIGARTPNMLMSTPFPPESSPTDQDVESVTVWQGRAWASISRTGFDEYFGDEADFTSYGIGRLPADAIATMTSAPAGALRRIARLVEQSRLEAIRRRVKIPTEKTWKALGFVKPEPHLLANPLVELPVEASFGAAPENEEAVSLAGETASDDDQPATRQAAPASTEQATPTHTPGATPELQDGPPQPLSVGDRHDGDRSGYGPFPISLCAARW